VPDDGGLLGQPPDHLADVVGDLPTVSWRRRQDLLLLLDGLGVVPARME